MTAVAVDDMLVEVVECRRGTVTLTTMPAGWEIIGRSNVHRAAGDAQTFVFRVPRCDCRTNPQSARLYVPHPRNGKSLLVRRNLGFRELCVKPVAHNDSCHTLLDHCESRGHEAVVRTLFDSVVKSYTTAVPSHETTIKKLLTSISAR